MKALIPAAGLGTRFLPATKAQPKEMLLVVDRPVIQYIVEEGLASAADEVVIINSREKKAIEDHFSPNPELVATLRERGKDKYADAVEEQKKDQEKKAAQQRRKEMEQERQRDWKAAQSALKKGGKHK